MSKVAETTTQYICLDQIELVNYKLKLEDVIKYVETAEAGAVATFVGKTKGESGDGRKVEKLVYEAYEPMARRELEKICFAIRHKWKVIHIALFHSIGEVVVAETSVVVAISAVHRKDALMACQYAIDEIKANVPIWKKEFYQKGVAEWKWNSEFLIKCALTCPNAKRVTL